MTQLTKIIVKSFIREIYSSQKLYVANIKFYLYVHTSTKNERLETIYQLVHSHSLYKIWFIWSTTWKPQKIICLSNQLLNFRRCVQKKNIVRISKKRDLKLPKKKKNSVNNLSVYAMSLFIAKKRFDAYLNLCPFGCFLMAGIL